MIIIINRLILTSYDSSSKIQTIPLLHDFHLHQFLVFIKFPTPKISVILFTLDTNGTKSRNKTIPQHLYRDLVITSMQLSYISMHSPLRLVTSLLVASKVSRTTVPCQTFPNSRISSQTSIA